MAVFEWDRIVGFLKAMGDPVRLEIVYLLSRQGRLNVGRLAANFELSRPAISHHLKVLKTAGIIEGRKAGQEMFYVLNGRAVAAELRDLADLVEEADESSRGG